MKDVLTRIAWKNHHNGALNPRAQFRKEVAKDTIACSPLVAGPLGIFDCSGVSDGSAAAIVVRAEDAYTYTDKPLYVKALSFVAGPAAGPIDPTYDYTTFREVVRSAEDAYQQAGITNPRAELAMAEVHDCFTPTELVLMEDLGLRRAGHGLEGGPRRDLRPRRRAAGQPRRRAEVASATRSAPPACACSSRLAAAAGRGPGRAPDRQRRRRQDQGPHPQPRRGARGVRELRVGRRLGAWLSANDLDDLTETGRLYHDVRERLIALVGTLDDAQLGAPVPACPQWHVRDVIAHLAGVCDDALTGHMEGAPGEAWTARQVEARRDASVADLLAAWARDAAPFERLPLPFQAVADVASHEQDIRGAVDRPGAARATPPSSSSCRSCSTTSSSGSRQSASDRSPS